MGRYDIPIPNRFLAPIDCSTIPAQYLAQEPVFVIVYGAQESIPPAFVAWRAGTTNRAAVPARQAGNRFSGSFTGLQIRAPFTRRCGDGLHVL